MRIIPARLKGKRKPVKPRHRKRWGKNLRTPILGHCVAFDTVILLIEGQRRYIFTAIDHAGRLAFALAVSRTSSQWAARFAQLVQVVFPFPIQNVFTGTFEQAVKKNHQQHFHTYPKAPAKPLQSSCKAPKMNISVSASTAPLTPCQGVRYKP